MSGPATISRCEIAALAERLLARAQTRLMNNTPELRDDLRLAALVLQYALAIGFPVLPIDLKLLEIGRGK